MIICSHDGHVQDDAEGPYCPDHGTPLFTHCPKCDQPWTTVGTTMYVEAGADFCVYCANPGPWVSREKRLAWIKGRLHQQGLDEATELDPRSPRPHQGHGPGDTRTIAAWPKLKDVAPKLWEIAKPIITTVATAEVKRRLGL